MNIKNVFSLIFLITSILTVHCQNKELDERNGFKVIKLGSHIDRFEGIKEIQSGDPNTIVGFWNTSDPDLGYLFDEKIDIFELGFDRTSKKLKSLKIVIYIKEPYYNPIVFEKFIKIYENIISVLGKPLGSMKDVRGFYWEGEKVAMALFTKAEELKLNDDGEVIGLSAIYLSFVSINSIINEAEKGF